MPDSQSRRSSIAYSSIIERATQTPWKFDLFMLLRWLDAKQPALPRFGTATRSSEEKVRLGQLPSLQFAPANISSINEDVKGRAVIRQRGFGLFGPNGPLPIHLTEYVRERTDNFRDRSMVEFADIFHHRFLLLFYRAWSHVQSTVSMDRPDEDRFTDYVASLVGYGDGAMRGSDDIPDSAKLYNAGHLVRLTRNPEGLVGVLSTFFDCQVRLEERLFHWLKLREEDQTRLGGESDQSRLGVGAICGSAVPDRQSRFRLHIGPLDLVSYQAFLPVGPRHRKLRDWVRNYVGLEYIWDVCLILRADEVPLTTLTGNTRLGWTTWLGRRTRSDDANDLVLDVEAYTKH